MVPIPLLQIWGGCLSCLYLFVVTNLFDWPIKKKVLKLYKLPHLKIFIPTTPTPSSPIMKKNGKENEIKGPKLKL